MFVTMGVAKQVSLAWEVADPMGIKVAQEHL